jgi:hypothetical protein
MNKKIMLLLLLINTSGTYADSAGERVVTDTHSGQIVHFQTLERLPTRNTAAKMTTQALKNCKSWRIHVQNNFSAQVSKLGECTKSGGICDIKHYCASYWSAEVVFNKPLTLVSRTRSFVSRKSQQSMDACLKWIGDAGKQESFGLFWSGCEYEDPYDENGEVIGNIISLPGRSSQSENQLLKHHQAQVQTLNAKLTVYLASDLEVSFPFSLHKNIADASDPEVRSSLADCENWRIGHLKKLSAQSASIEACKLNGSTMCNLPSIPTCFFSHIARISWKNLRTLYSVERTFISPHSASQASDNCLRWLKGEQEFAPIETIYTQCSKASSRNSGGRMNYYVVGLIYQTEIK